MNSIAIQAFETPFGELLLGVHRDRLCLCDWRFRKMRERIDARIQQGLEAGYEERDDPLFAQVRRQLDEYFRRGRTSFDVPLSFVGTDFQKRVWNGLLQIPYGETRSYAELAQQAGSPGSVRAVGTANGANALSIVVPCHRVIGADGRLAGYAGGTRVKKRLLELENGS